MAKTQVPIRFPTSHSASDVCAWHLMERETYNLKGCSVLHVGHMPLSSCLLPWGAMALFPPLTSHPQRRAAFLLLRLTD
eukprot:8986396-Pyramimonas_sp.AAC.1